MFHIRAIGAPIATNIDIYQRAGGIKIPYDLNGTATSAGSSIYALFVAVESSAIFAGIEVIPLVRYADKETPAGLQGGSNRSFVLKAAPNPPESLDLTLNGLGLKPGTDFVLDGAAISFAPRDIPSGRIVPLVPGPDDILLASYRY